MLRGRLDDPDVGLMRDEQVNIVGTHSGSTKGFIARLGHCEDRRLEHLTAGHLHVVRPLAHDPLADWIRGTTAGAVEQRRQGAIGFEERGKNAASIVASGSADHSSTGTIAEENSGGPILKVGNGGELFGAYNENDLALA